MLQVNTKQKPIMVINKDLRSTTQCTCW